MLDEFAKLRPALFHLTAGQNVERIKSLGMLHSAAELIQTEKRDADISCKRNSSIVINIDGEQIHIRDQSVLYENNCHFSSGFTFGQLVELLNQHVFFWPGNQSGPIKSGLNHFKRYAKTEDVVVISVPTAEIISANADQSPLVSKYNSGSPRCHPIVGRSPRGPQTFVDIDQAPFTAGKIVEFVYRGSVRIPWEQVTVRPAHEYL